MLFGSFMVRMQHKATVFALASTTLVMAGELAAAPFAYTGRDLLLGFRQPDSVSEMVVNLGHASNYFKATPGSLITIKQFTPTQLQTAFSTLNGLLWSVSGTTRLGDGGDPSIPDTTLWMTRARTAVATQSAPWLRKSTFSQGGAANKVNELGVNTTLLSDSTPANPILNTVTAVIEPTGESRSYGLVIGSQGNFLGNFQGNVENNTGSTFNAPVRSDLYELRPGTGNLPGLYLGYFELRPDGTMAFQAAGGSTPFHTRIESISRVGTTNTISFTTTNDAAVTYRLVFTNNTGLTSHLTNWPAGAATVTGNGQVRSLQDYTAVSDRFYSVRETR